MSTNLTKREIVLEIYEKTGFPQKQIQDTVQMTLDIVMDALAAGRNVELRNFGGFASWPGFRAYLGSNQRSARRALWVRDRRYFGGRQ